MPGTKTNERPGVRAQSRFERFSPSKARQVLDLIRGESVARALEILDFVERDAANAIRKTLESAVANAEHNDGIAADELAVVACYADEGPTLRRWRPRARGRATRINKRTSHITIIVNRMDAEQIARLEQRDQAAGSRAASGGAAAEARRARVERSRQAKAERDAEEREAAEDDEVLGEAEVAQDAVTSGEAEAPQVGEEEGPEAEQGPEAEVEQAGASTEAEASDEQSIDESDEKGQD